MAEGKSQTPRRIVVKGGSGSGKSTLAQSLAQTLGLPYVELDALHHGPNWAPTPAARFQKMVRARLLEPGWVVDGNYDAKLGRLVLDRADLIIWLDLPLPTKLARLARRTAMRITRRKVLWNGNRESLASALWGRESLFVWAVSSHFRQRRSWPHDLAGLPVVRLSSAAQVAEWLTAAGTDA